MAVYEELAEGPGVVRRIFLAFNTPPPHPPISVHNKFQPNRSSRLAIRNIYIYDGLVLLYSQLNIPVLGKLKVGIVGQKAVKKTI